MHLFMHEALSGEAAAVSFIGNPQRFNVALSRAQHMMVVVGDPWVLNMDRCARARACCRPCASCRKHFIYDFPFGFSLLFCRCWGTLLRYCIGNHAYAPLIHYPLIACDTEFL
jgi:hypothetical protein